MLTTIALDAAIAATAMTLPLFVQSFSWLGILDGPDHPSGWQYTMWFGAFYLGVGAMLIGTTQWVREKRRGARAGRRRAAVGIGVATVGSILWAWTLFLASLEGL